MNCEKQLKVKAKVALSQQSAPAGLFEGPLKIREIPLSLIFFECAFDAINPKLEINGFESDYLFCFLFRID